MSTATAPAPSAPSVVQRVPCCPEHGVTVGVVTCCRVCGGPVEQVAMVPVVDPERGPCGCGCGHPKRANSDYASDPCRTRHWKRLTGYVDPRRTRSANAANGGQTRLLRPSRPGGRQIAWGPAVRVLAQYLVEANVIADKAQAVAVAEKVLERALPERQRNKRARARGAKR